ncbi:precorrin-8X methylmutase [Raineyella antarctica]|uniref:Precorrin-8X methylmutase n=1 Tax=Raineyella antarctica TaxID=1577474 RepID=A0A1G6GDM4_9ACTN|nr:precorrin-8X methylmutase [Raineyella antarctica]SDB79933.1 precorrin-8X methylmutase [Raineyella antarctica]
MGYIRSGSEIYAESFAIIRAESRLGRFPADLEHVVVRMVHAAADPLIADLVAFTPGVVGSTRAALAQGAPILCDSTMTAAGVIRSRLPAGNEVVCLLSDPALAAYAAERGTTRTAAAVERWMDRIDGAVVAIGNAPTALFHLLELLALTPARPAAVVGIPVGFVGAAESKQALVDNTLGLEYLTVTGRRGGSAIAAAALNALASEAE